MPLQFILGGAGSGKSTLLYQNLLKRSEDEGGHYFLVVPEQYTLKTQRRLVEMQPEHSIFAIDIVSFARLSYRIFEELNIQTPDLIDETGKCLVLRRVMDEVKDQLAVYGAKVGTAGFTDKMKSMISECAQYRVDDAALDQMIQSASHKPLLAAKLKDTQVIYRAFSAYLSDHYITQEEILDRFLAVIPESKLLRRSEIAFDGFVGQPFTPVQYQIIGELIRVCKKVTVTLCISREAIGRTVHGTAPDAGIFSFGLASRERIAGMARDAGEKVLQDIIPEPPVYKKSPALRHLEAHIFRHYGARKETAGTSVALLSCQNPRAEALLAAQTIRAAADAGMRYREMAVVTADMKTYRRYLEAAFKDYEIPFFADDKTGLMEHPYIEAQRSFLDMLAGDFTYESVMRFLRCGFHPFPQEDVDAFAMYLRAAGIRGFSRWNQPFTWVSERMTEDDLHLYDVMRQTIAAWAWGFVRGRKKMPVKQWISSMRALLEELCAADHLAVLSEYWTGRGEYEKASVTDQLFDKVSELYDKTERLLADEPVAAKEFLDLLTAGFENMKIAVIPPTLDQVMILDSARSRAGDISLLIFPGLNEGQIPKAKESSGILSQGDREFLKQMKFELAPTVREASNLEMFSLYTWFSRPTDRLILSFSRADMQGKAMKPSGILGMVQTLYSDLSVHAADAESVRTKAGAKKMLASGLRAALEDAGTESQTGSTGTDSTVKELYQIFCRLAGTNPEDEKFLDLVLDGTFFRAKEEQLSGEASEKLFAEGLYGSITALEQYASCGYRFFLEHGLCLEPPQEYQTTAADLGTLFHDALQAYSRNLRNRNLRWDEISDETRSLMVKEAVSEAAARSKSQALYGTARNAYMLHKVERITERSAWVLGEHIRRSRFYPAYYELPVENGRVDRIDLYEEDGTIYVKVIDYKSGKTKFDFTDTYYGLQLQLVLYLEQVMSFEQHKYPRKKIVPAGMFYYNLKDPMLEAGTDDRPSKSKEQSEEEQAQEEAAGERLRERLLGEFRMSGVVNDDPEIIAALDESLADGSGKSDMIPVSYTKSGLGKTSSTLTTGQFEGMISYAAKKAAGLREDVKHGKISVNPYKKGTSVPCEYCAFQGICGFDRKLPGYHYRTLTSISRDEILAAFEGEE